MAQNNLGVKYENGEGVPQDYKEAMKWYRLAIEQGLGIAQARLPHQREGGVLGRGKLKQ
jgi:TPR repeat protein